MPKHAAVFLLLVLSLGPARAGEVLVAVAANFAAPMKRIAEDFSRVSGHRAILSFGSTGKLYAQIRNGAPFEVLLAADEATPARLEGEGLGVAGSRFTYAVGRLALWSAEPGRVDADGKVLATGGFERLAIADPKLAPYGAAAVEVLQALGRLDSLRPRLVTAESVGQAYQFVATGNAEIGFVALSQVLEEGALRAGSLWRVPAGLHHPLRQDFVILAAGRRSAAATALAGYLRSDAAREVLRGFGYGIAD